jgi:hypothetical protein
MNLRTRHLRLVYVQMHQPKQEHRGLRGNQVRTIEDRIMHACILKHICALLHWNLGQGCQIGERNLS